MEFSSYSAYMIREQGPMANLTDAEPMSRRCSVNKNIPLEITCNVKFDLAR